MKNSSKRLKVIQPEKFIICKKILTLVLLINIQACYSAAVIDDFVENSLDKNLQISLTLLQLSMMNSRKVIKNTLV